jgi:hypothetical protein
VTTPSRAEAVAALLAALREVRDANERLAITAAWVLDAYGDTSDAETIRMLPVGGSARPGKPAVPPPVRSERLTDALTLLADLDPKLREPLTSPDSVTRDENTGDYR